VNSVSVVMVAGALIPTIQAEVGAKRREAAEMRAEAEEKRILIDVGDEEVCLRYFESFFLGCLV